METVPGYDALDYHRVATIHKDGPVEVGSGADASFFHWVAEKSKGLEFLKDLNDTGSTTHIVNTRPSFLSGGMKTTEFRYHRVKNLEEYTFRENGRLAVLVGIPHWSRRTTGYLVLHESGGTRDYYVFVDNCLRHQHQSSSGKHAARGMNVCSVPRQTGSRRWA